MKFEAQFSPYTKYQTIYQISPLQGDKGSKVARTAEEKQSKPRAMCILQDLRGSSLLTGVTEESGESNVGHLGWTLIEKSWVGRAARSRKSGQRPGAL